MYKKKFNSLVKSELVTLLNTKKGYKEIAEIYETTKQNVYLKVKKFKIRKKKKVVEKRKMFVHKYEVVETTYY